MSGERYADMAVVLVVTLSLQILPVIISPGQRTVIIILYDFPRSTIVMMCLYDRRSLAIQ